ncbi:MAG: hypothetical protein M1419_00570 [Bacteroidetes bacterium]|nr:hypothetical protein [Bacteroidota bacterium]
MKKLNNITLVIVDCVNSNRAIHAIRKSTQYFEFEQILFFTSLSITSDNYKIISINKINSVSEYSVFILQELYKYIETDYCLIIQWDGFILNPEAWSDEFLQYDYIGAPWSDAIMNGIFKRDGYTDSYRVGNGGFSLRSKKLLELLPTSIPINWAFINRGWYYCEDLVICKQYRDKLEAQGIKFAPVELASKFSVEDGIYEGQFGFHNNKKEFEIYRL